MRGFWIIMTCLLLLIAASRITRLNDHIMNRDEVWSVWQTFGTPEQIIQWTPYDWPPLYYLSLGAWRSSAGILPQALRALSALLFLLGVVCLFRVMRRWQGWQAGGLAALAYAGLGFSIQLSMEVRGYALLLALMPLALWLMLRYFDHPDWKRALPLALAMAAMFYTSLTSVVAFVSFGLLSLFIYGRAFWRWWLPGVMAAVLAAPVIISKAQYVTSRTAATQTLVVPPLPQALLQLFQEYTGFTFVIWVLLLVAAITLAFYRRHKPATFVALLTWVLVIPVVLYVLNPVLGFFSARYAWFILPGIALLLGWGLAYLPRIGQVLAGVALAGCLFVPLPRDGQYQIWDVLSPLGENFVWLREQMQWGDVILNNPRHQCGAPEEWDYYLQAYFPNGLRFTNSVLGQRRLWVLNPSDLPDEVRADLNDHYLRGRFVGPPGCLLRLYEAPPDREGVLFENGMRFHGVDVLRDGNLATGPLVWHEGETVHLRLWWSADFPLALDYSVGTSLGRGHNAYDQFDGPPQVLGSTNAPPETSRWLPGLYYIEERELKLPFPASGTYTIDMAVYFWADAIPVAAPGVDENGRLPLLRVKVQSY